MNQDNTIPITITADNQTGPAFAQATGQVQGFTTQVGTMAAGMATALVSVEALKEGFHKLTEFVKGTIDVVRDLEIAQARLALTVKATGQAFETGAPIAAAWLAKMHELSTLTETQLVNGLRTLTEHTNSLAAAELLGADAANVAARTGQSYEEVTHRLGLALEGNTRGLREYAIQLDAAAKTALMHATVEERAAFIHAALMEKYGGSSQQLLGTYAEQIKLLTRSWEEFKIALGDHVLPVLTEVLGRINDAIKAIPLLIEANLTGIRHLKQFGLGLLGLDSTGGGGGGGWGAGGLLPNQGSNAVNSAIFGEGGLGQPGESSASIMARIQARQAEAGIAAAIADAMARANHQVKASVDSLVDSYEKVTKVQLKWLVDDAKAWQAQDAAANHMVETLARVRESFEKFQGGTAGNPFAMDALAAITQLEADYQKKIAAINAASFAEWVRQADQIAKTLDDSAQFVGREYQKTASEFVKNIQQPLAHIFSDIANGGVGAALAKQFTKGIDAGSNDLAKIFGGIILGAFGGKPDASKFDLTTPEGKAAFATANQASQQQLQKIGQVIADIGVVAGAAMHASDVISGKVHESAVATIVSFTAAGASVGGWIGAVVGFVVGAVAAAFAPSVGKSYKYATFGFNEDGSAFVNPNKNIGAGEANAMLQALNAEMQGVRNAYVKILLKFPGEVMADILGFDFSKLNPTYTTAGTAGKTHGGFWAMLADSLTGAWALHVGGHGSPWDPKGTPGVPGEIGGAASAHFMENFDNWVKNVLPTKIAAQFQDSVSKSFTAMGMTVDQFNQIWKSMQGMDPVKALQMLGDLADALIGFAKTQTAMDNLSKLFPTRGTARTPQQMPDVLINPDGSFRNRGVNDFAQALIDGQENLGKLAVSVRTLVGPDQIAAAKSLSDSMTGMVQNLIQYLNQILALQKQLSTSIEQQKSALIYAQITDPNKQTEYLVAQLTGVQNQLRNAQRLGLNPSDIQALTAQGQQLVGQISAIDPSHRLDWSLKALDDLNAAQIKALTAMGKQAQDLVASELKVLQPVLDWFKGLPAVVGSGFNNLADSTNNVIDAFDRFRARLDDANFVSNSRGGSNFESATASRRVGRGRV